MIEWIHYINGCYNCQQDSPKLPVKHPGHLNRGKSLGSAGGLLSSPGRKVGLRRQSTQKSNTSSTQHNIVVVKPALPQESTDTDVDILRLQVCLLI